MLIAVSCSGQELPKTFNNTPAKLVKTQGSNAYQNVHCGLQDKAGNLWFGTTGEGVYRYDGNSFTQFTVKDGLTSNTIWSVLEDKTGKIWLGTANGICCYDGKKMLSVSIASGNTKSPGNVWSMLETKNGTILFGTDDGVYCYDGKVFSSFLDTPGLKNENGLTLKNVQCMFEDKDGKLWFGSGPLAFEGVCLYDGKSLTGFKPENEGWIRTISEDKQENLLFVTRHKGLISLDGKITSGCPEPAELKKDLLNAAFTDSKGNTWYGSDYVSDNDVTKGGVWKSAGNSFIGFAKDAGLENTAAFLFLEDRSGNIWIGTRNTGLYRYDGSSFTSFSE